MLIERDLFLKIKPYLAASGAVVITGMRRVGKTTMLRQIMEEIKSENKVFLDMENPANRKYFEEDNYEKILNNLIFLGLNSGKRGYIFLDEIQFVKNIPSVVKYLSDHYKINFFLSGSLSFYLKNLFYLSKCSANLWFKFNAFYIASALTKAKRTSDFSP